ncbi:MAG: hypothetical protein ACI9Y7_000251 [Dokdonia sp.]|jgi:hypothetical protein
MSNTIMPKKDLGETPARADISTLNTGNAQPSKAALSIGEIHITNPTKKEQGDAFAKAIKKEYNDANMYK